MPSTGQKVDFTQSPLFEKERSLNKLAQTTLLHNSAKTNPSTCRKAIRLNQRRSNWDGCKSGQDKD